MIYKSLSLLVGTVSSLYTSWILFNFMHFLFCHYNVKNAPVNQTDEILIGQTLWSLLINASLLSAFMFQHSLMKSSAVKDLFCKLRIEEMTRSIYNLSTAGLLNVLMNNWILMPHLSIWKLDTNNSNTLWLTFVSFHVVGWSIIYSGCVIMDISELAGLKQIYYKISGRPDPMIIKSKELQRYFNHMRHPSFIGFLMILWIHPLMSIDRILLGSILTLYMALMWSVDEDDYDYHAKIITQKRKELF